MKKLSNILFMAGVALMATLTITSCKLNVPDTNPLNKQGVNLVAYGPNPVARGGYLRILGTGLDQVQTVTIAGQEITPFEVVNNEEIKVLIPQDAKIGDLVLTPKSGDPITGKKKITYTEPVGFDKEPFDPATIKAGQTLTINGEYLNLVTKVILPEGVEVTKFKEHDRKHIVIENFPAEAQTGKVTLSFVATGDTMAQAIPSSAELNVVLPSVEKIKEFTEVKAADQLEIEGKDFDLVEEVVTDAGDTLDYTISNDGTKLLISMPDVVVNCIINAVPASGVLVPVATVGVALPKVESVEGNTNVKEGSVITINGTDMAIVSGVNFFDIKGNAVAAAEDGLSVTDTKVTVTLPAAAVSGAMVIKTTAGIDVEDEALTIKTLQPAVTGFNPEAVAMGGTVAVNGTNLDLVAKVTLFGGAELKPADASETTFNLTIPYADAETGEVKLTMHNGETVVTEVKLTINAPECCYATAWPDPELEIKAGTMMVITVANIDKLTGVKIDGQDCQIIKLGDQLYIAVPDAAGKSSVITLVSENGSIDYPFAFIPNTEQKRSLWKGALPISWSDEGKAHILASAMAEVPAGAELVMCYTQIDQTWGQAQMCFGNWSKKLLPDGTTTTGDGALVPTDIYGWFTDGILYRETPIVLSEAVLADMRANLDDNGYILHIQGSDLILNEVYVRWTISLETVLATGNWEAMGWGNQPKILESGVLGAAGAKAGQTLRIYVTPAADNWACQIVSGWWGAIGTDKYPFNTEGNPYDLAAHNGALEIKLDAADVAGFDTEGIVVNGDQLTITKVTLE